jgi:hypothetical protein
LVSAIVEQMWNDSTFIVTDDTMHRQVWGVSMDPPRLFSYYNNCKLQGFSSNT